MFVLLNVVSEIMSDVRLVLQIAMLLITKIDVEIIVILKIMFSIKASVDKLNL